MQDAENSNQFESRNAEKSLLKEIEEYSIKELQEMPLSRIAMRFILMHLLYEVAFNANIELQE